MNEQVAGSEDTCQPTILPFDDLASAPVLEEAVDAPVVEEAAIVEEEDVLDSDEELEAKVVNIFGAAAVPPKARRKMIVTEINGWNVYYTRAPSKESKYISWVAKQNKHAERYCQSKVQLQKPKASKSPSDPLHSRDSGTKEDTLR